MLAVIVRESFPNRTPGGSHWEYNQGKRLVSLEYGYNCQKKGHLSTVHTGATAGFPPAVSPALWSLWSLSLGLGPEKALACVQFMTDS